MIETEKSCKSEHQCASDNKSTLATNKLSGGGKPSGYKTKILSSLT